MAPKRKVKAKAKPKAEPVKIRVARGAALLDRKVPGWYREIALKANGGVHLDVDMKEGHLCILGRTFGQYFKGTEALGLGRWETPGLDRRAHKYGFFDNSDAWHPKYTGYALAWENEVFHRLRKDALGKIKLANAEAQCTGEIA